MHLTEAPARPAPQTPKIPLWRRVVAPLFGLIPVIFFGGICYGCYWLSADEPVVTEEAYNRQIVLDDVCKGEALMQHPGELKISRGLCHSVLREALADFRRALYPISRPY